MRCSRNVPDRSRSIQSQGAAAIALKPLVDLRLYFAPFIRDHSLKREEWNQPEIRNFTCNVRTVSIHYVRADSVRTAGRRVRVGLGQSRCNVRKHGVSFHAACEVFFDPFVRIVDASNPTESREAAIGYTEGERLLFVVHVIRHEETIRIISAREATREERRQYENP